jgi:predicted benzoate:H+ symporter BenE
VNLIQSGDAEYAEELASGFGMALLVGVFCVYCVLLLLFKDFLQPITILSAIPLSLGGAFLALLLLRSELDVPSMTSRRPKTRYATGGGAKPVLFLRKVLPDRAFDAMMLMGARPQKKVSL